MRAEIEPTRHEKYLSAAEILKAIGHPNRLQILKYLEDEEYKAVFEIQEETGMEPTLLSHHLNKMKDKGILTSIKNGRFIYYRLALPEVINVLNCIDNCHL